MILKQNNKNVIDFVIGDKSILFTGINVYFFYILGTKLTKRTLKNVVYHGDLVFFHQLDSVLVVDIMY